MSPLSGGAVRAVDAICARVLEDYLADPWRWPRESDLIVDLVVLLRDELRTRGESDRVAATPLLQSWYESITPLSIHIPRVRTELKLASPNDEESDADGDRTDIGILRATGATIHFQPHGVRDVTLRVNIEDVEDLLEVKVCPHLYLPTRPSRGPVSMWLDDLTKLHRVGQRCLTIEGRALLCIDTSLPLEAAGLRYGPGRRASNRATKLTDPARPDISRVWPLLAQDYTIRSYIADTGKVLDIDFKLCDPSSPDPGLHFWALGVDRSIPQKSLFPAKGRLGEMFGSDEVQPCCWLVSIRERAHR